MATAIFDGTGADATDWSAQDNWTGGTGTSGVPGSGDDVLVKSIPANVTTNCTAFSAVNINSFKVTQECEKSLGGSADAITFGTVGSVTYGGKGEYTKFSGTVTLADLNHPGGTFILTGGTWTTVNSGGVGKVLVGASATVTNAYNAGVNWADESGTAYTVFDHGAGQTNTRRSIGTAHVNSGPFTLSGAAAVTTKITVYAQGILNDQSSGTLTLLEVKPKGMYTLAQNPYPTKTLTNHTVWKGATVQKQAPGLTVTESNAPVYKGLYLTEAA